MSDQPTPETDAFQASGKGYYMACEFARRLERERDEARDALSGRTVSCSQCDQVAAERDEARDLARELRGHLQNLVDHGVCNCCHDDEADEDWLSAKSALTKAKEVLP